MAFKKCRSDHGSPTSAGRKQSRRRTGGAALNAPPGECRDCWERADAATDATPMIMPDMLSERMQRRVLHLLVQAEEAADHRDWETVAESARMVLAIDPYNSDAQALAFLVAHAGTMSFEGPNDFPAQGW